MDETPPTPTPTSDAAPAPGGLGDPVAELRAAVLARTPVDARERESITRFVEQLDQLDRPFDEHADPVHVTGSAVVVSEAGVALHKHKRLGLWLQPGGHIEPGETPWQAAQREAVEETGLPVAFTGDQPPLIGVDVHPGPRGHTHLDVRYLLTSPPVAPRPADGESPDVRWFPWAEAIALSDPGLEGTLRTLQPGEPSLRPAVVADAAAVAHVYLRSRDYGIPDVPWVHAGDEVTTFFATQVIGHAEVTVADLDGTIVGMLVLRPDGDHDTPAPTLAAPAPAGVTGWIDHLYLDPAWMGRGLGGRLLDVARQRFPDGLQLWTFQVNERARRFYARAGFVEVEHTDGAGNEERTPDVRCHWRP